ncbi:hypothetical protein [Pseudoalteromonas sp. APC 3691]|uniref:hypothetical protein n=1 Tax=Pseudoalteromonas sp. APC 3691 TaxID=3035173 RepID=UPI0025B5BD0C|nr:hypothetical protein [Pseudoalteromonas sp. APC 3691]MDN3390877.1 hypothetical protein [Pseudoalteromonas sp. APC 3691]
MDMEIYRKQYDFEMEQRNGIASATNIPIVALTIIGGALSSVVIGFKFNSNIQTYLFITFVSLCALSKLWTVYYIARSFIGYVYQKIPPSKELADYFKSLRDWHKEKGETDDKSNELAQTDFDEYLKNRFSEASERNGNNNIMRGNYLHGSTVAVSVSFVLLACASPLYIYQKVTSGVQIYEVKIIENIKSKTKEVKMAENNETTNQTPTSAADTTPSAAPGAKPQGPANWEFKGNADIGNIQTKTDTSSTKGKK